MGEKITSIRANERSKRALQNARPMTTISNFLLKHFVGTSDILSVQYGVIVGFYITPVHSIKFLFSCLWSFQQNTNVEKKIRMWASLEIFCIFTFQNCYLIQFFFVTSYILSVWWRSNIAPTAPPPPTLLGYAYGRSSYTTNHWNVSTF